MLLSICITSYNRPHQLSRCLNSIPSFDEDVEIVVSDDASPKQHIIRKIVNTYIKTTSNNVRFSALSNNIGYDHNLLNLINISSGEYILFITDDDSFESTSLIEFYSHLNSTRSPMYFLPFQNNLGQQFRLNTSGSKGHLHGSKLYFPILVSGIVLRRSYLPSISPCELKNLIYTQVYLSYFIMIKYGYNGYFKPVIYIHEDGENGFGLSSSSDKNSLLADRSHYLSNIEFNKKLLDAVSYSNLKIPGYNLLNNFKKEYSFRSFGRFYYASRFGRLAVFDTLLSLFTVIDKYRFLPFLYFLFVFSFGRTLSGFVISSLRKIYPSRF